MKLRSALLVASLLAPVAALAQPITGPYISLGAGASIFQDQSLKNITAPNFGTTFANPGSISYDPYVAGQASVGWGFGNGFRAELSGVYQRSRVSSISKFSGAGYADATGAFANVVYDFDLTPFGVPGLAPYAGAGVGYEEEHLDGPHATSFIGNQLDLEGTKGSVGVDALLGLAYNIPGMPGLALTAEYRFTAIPSSETFGGTLTIPPGYPNVSYTREKVDNLFGHSGMLGLRYALWQPPAPTPPAPPAPPPPPAAPTPVRTYLVFFDWDRADLTMRAKQIVAEAAQASTHVQTTQIEVNGYTDLSGTVAYNERLSVRRAKTVEAELIRDGVPGGEISIHGYGESNPLVPTAPGVREPQNRRVEIILK
jgi:outer membrane protein OmpA-like peptidoglycan-associated protein